MAHVNQPTEHKLKALIAGSESGYSHGACQVLEQLNIDYIHVPNAQTALNEVNASAGSFFVILTDQTLPDMSGTSLLAQVNARHPDVLGFLLSDRFDADLLMTAVNDAGVRQCILTPFTQQDLAERIKQAQATYNQEVERRRMFNLARKQNVRLYELNCELIETVKDGEKEVSRLEKQAKELHDQLKASALNGPLSPGKLAEMIKKNLDELKEDQARTLGQWYEQTIAALFTDLNDFALGNGIDIGEPCDLIFENPTEKTHPGAMPGRDVDVDAGTGDLNA